MLGVALLVPAVLVGVVWSAAAQRGQESTQDTAELGDQEQGDLLASGGGQFDQDEPEFPIDNRYSPVARALSDMVVAASFGEDGNILFGPIQGLEFAPAISRSVTEIRLDASGNWIAAVYRNSFRQDVLIVGAADADVERWRFEPLAVGINGFAWHPHRPGRIAYAVPDLPTATQITDVDLTSEQPRKLRYRAEFPGRLRLWGDWGYAFNEPGPTPLTTVGLVPSDATPTADNLLETLVAGTPGRAMGLIAPRRLLVDGGESAIVVNLDNAVYEPNVWYDSSARRCMPSQNRRVASTRSVSSEVAAARTELVARSFCSPQTPSPRSMPPTSC